MKIQKLESVFYQINKYLFLITFFIITSLLLFVAPSLEYLCKKTFQFDNITLLIFDILVVCVIFAIMKFTKKYYCKIQVKNIDIVILICSIILFFIQLYIGYNILFLTGWDAGAAVFPAADLASTGSSMNDFNAYFSTYPNNILLVWIFSKVFKIASLFNSDTSKTALMIIVMINSLISSLSGFLTYKVVEKLTSKKWAVFSWIVYFLLIGTSGWIVIPYSDSFGLFLPILIFYIYTREFNDKYKLLKWFLIGLLSFLGYRIKPQVIIIFIAIMLVELVRFIYLSNTEKRKKLPMVGILVIAFVVSGIFYKIVVIQTGLTIDKEKTFGVTHFAMMGMDKERDGVFSPNDVNYSSSFQTAKERNRADRRMIGQRLREFGVVGYAQFLEKKILVNYGDGTFAWGMEGGFYNEVYENNSSVSQILKRFYYNSGENYKTFSTFEQAIWIAVILFMLGIVFIKKNELDKRIIVLMMSLVGLTIFEMIFEARARYLYIYAPIFITLSIVGLKNIINFFKKKLIILIK